MHAMLTRLYCDNYKCLVNFEFRPEATQLLMGRNGAGKSTVFEVLELIRDFAARGETCEDRRALTRCARLCPGGSKSDSAIRVSIRGDSASHGPQRSPRSRRLTEERDAIYVAIRAGSIIIGEQPSRDAPPSRLSSKSSERRRRPCPKTNVAP